VPAHNSKVSCCTVRNFQRCKIFCKAGLYGQVLDFVVKMDFRGKARLPGFAYKIEKATKAAGEPFLRLSRCFDDADISVLLVKKDSLLKAKFDLLNILKTF
jgi:hypothetical protein